MTFVLQIIAEKKPVLRKLSLQVIANSRDPWLWFTTLPQRLGSLSVSVLSTTVKPECHVSIGWPWRPLVLQELDVRLSAAGDVWFSSGGHQLCINELRCKGNSVFWSPTARCSIMIGHMECGALRSHPELSKVNSAEPIPDQVDF